MNYLKEISKAKAEKKAIVFNFSTKELHYTHRDWIVKDVIQEED